MSSERAQSSTMPSTDGNSYETKEPESLRSVGITQPKAVVSAAILIPTYNNAPVLNKCLGYLDRLNPQPKFYIFFENNSQDDTWIVLKEWQKKHPNSIFLRMWFVPDAVKILGNPYSTIGLVRQYLLMKARLLDVDYAIFLDDDVFVADTDFLTKMIKWKLDILGGCYLRVYPQGLYLAQKWWNTNPKTQKQFAYTLKKACRGLERVAMTSGGCMCISRKLMMEKRINFYPVLDPDKFGDTSEDYGYCLQALFYGYEIYVDGSIKLGHFLKPRNYKPWCADPSKKSDGKKGSYINFKYGNEKALIDGRTNSKLVEDLINARD